MSPACTTSSVFHHPLQGPPLPPKWPRHLNREGKQQGFQKWERGWGWGRSRGGEALQPAQPAQPVGGVGKQKGTSARSTDSVSLYSMDVTAFH